MALACARYSFSWEKGNVAFNIIKSVKNNIQGKLLNVHTRCGLQWHFS